MAFRLRFPAATIGPGVATRTKGTSHSRAHLNCVFTRINKTCFKGQQCREDTCSSPLPSYSSVGRETHKLYNVRLRQCAEIRQRLPQRKKKTHTATCICCIPPPINVPSLAHSGSEAGVVYNYRECSVSRNSCRHKYVQPHSHGCAAV